MNASERFKKIKKNWMKYGHFGEPEDEAIDWLIVRVKRLTEFTEKIAIWGGDKISIMPVRALDLYGKEARKVLEEDE